MAVPASALAMSMTREPAAAAVIDGGVSMAMHLHTSFSEGYGSMEGHVQQASVHGVDVVWWTDHDNTLNAVGHKKVVHFSSLTAEEGDGRPLQWTQGRTGALTAASGGGIVTTPASPLDPVAAGSLHVTAQGIGSSTASVAYFPAFTPGHASWRGNFTGQTVSIEVLPTTLGPGCYLEFLIVSSHHPAVGGRSAGRYSLSYRLQAGKGATRSAVDRLGVVTLPFTPGAWNSLVLNLENDLASLFPGVDPRDFSFHTFRLVAKSVSGRIAEGYFDYLRFSRPTTGEAALTVQHDLSALYAARYPEVTEHQGVELSPFQPHINWYGGDVSLPTYAGVTTKNYFDYVGQTLIPDIHRAGGLASYNHPYGVSVVPPAPAATQDRLLRDIATRMLPAKACGADILEVGYPKRGGADLAHHVGLWDVMSRNAVFLTGNGVSDDHASTDWRHTASPNWITYVWAPDRGEASLLSALLAGQAWCTFMNDYRGALDLRVDGVAPMGSVSVSRLSSRSVTAIATGLPTGATVEVVQGQVDYAGTADPFPTSRVIASFTAQEMAAGETALSVDTTVSSFVRTQVRSSANEVVGLSNPVWLLREPPPNGIPAPRAA